MTNAIQKIVRSESDFYEQIWSSLTIVQKRLLVGLTIEPRANRYMQSFINQFDLKTATHVKRTFGSLEKKRAIEKEKITDIFFVEWIKTSIA